MEPLGPVEKIKIWTELGRRMQMPGAQPLNSWEQEIYNSVNYELYFSCQPKGPEGEIRVFINCSPPSPLCMMVPIKGVAPLKSSSPAP